MKKLILLIPTVIITLFFVACKSDEQKREDAIREIMNSKIADMSSYEVVNGNFRDSLMGIPFDYEIVNLGIATADSIKAMQESIVKLHNYLSHIGVEGTITINLDSLDNDGQKCVIDFFETVRKLTHSYQGVINCIDSKNATKVKRVRNKYRYKNANGELSFGIGLYFFDEGNNVSNYILTDENSAALCDMVIGAAVQKNFDWISLFLQQVGFGWFTPEICRGMASYNGAITKSNFSGGGFFISANNLPDKNFSAPQNLYEVYSRKITELNGIRKVTYIIKIPSEYDKMKLDEISDYLKRSETGQYVFIEYYLQNQPLNGGNYAISKRTPQEVSTTINYVTSPKEPNNVKAPYDGCEIYGKWSMYGATLIVYKKNGKTYMINYYGDNNYGDEELYRKTSYRGKTAFVNTEDPADMYVINANGDLDGYNMGELATTFSRME